MVMKVFQQPYSAVQILACDFHVGGHQMQDDEYN